MDTVFGLNGRPGSAAPTKPKKGNKFGVERIEPEL
jgi:hypothetical protein